MLCCRHFYCVRIEPHFRHQSAKFLTKQTDQSKRNILIDDVLNYFFVSMSVELLWCPAVTLSENLFSGVKLSIKPGFHKSHKDHKHMVANTFFKLFMYALVFT